MWKAIQMFKASHKQTKYFIFTLVLYMVAILWTTFQAYARLEYSRSDSAKPLLIQPESYQQ